MYNVTVYVTLKEGVLDPQGKAVQDSLHSLGFDEAGDVRIGKYIQLAVDATSKEVASERVQKMCKQLLANPVIEDYTFEVADNNE